MNTQIFAFKVQYEGGHVSGRIEATDAQHAAERLKGEYENILHGNVKLLKNQELARKGVFWELESV